MVILRAGPALHATTVAIVIAVVRAEFVTNPKNSQKKNVLQLPVSGDYEKENAL